MVNKSAVDAGIQPSNESDDAEVVKSLERENRECKRASEILSLMSACFAQAELIAI